MDNTSKLEQLKAQRRELDRQIKELSHPKYEVDGARLVFKTYKTCREDEWVVSLEEIVGVHKNLPHTSRSYLPNQKMMQSSILKPR